MALDCPLFVVKKAVIKYTYPAQTPSTRSIFKIDIHVYVEADDEVTKYKNTCDFKFLTIKMLLIHVLLKINISGDCV